MCATWRVQPDVCNLVYAAWYVQIDVCNLVCATWCVQPSVCKLMCATWYVQPGVCNVVCAQKTKGHPLENQWIWIDRCRGTEYYSAPIDIDPLDLLVNDAVTANIAIPPSMPPGKKIYQNCVSSR